MTTTVGPFGRAGMVDPVDGQTLRPHPARVYDCLLGGKDHYRHDRQVAAALSDLAPGLRVSVRAGRRFMARVVRCLAAEHGIRQFIDVGAGIPSVPNLHEIAQQEQPSARVVYVDHDPMVLAHDRALLTGGARAVVRCVEADLRDPVRLLSAPGVVRTLDPREPVAITLLGVLHEVADEREARSVVEALLSPWPSGSAVVISTGWTDGSPAQARALSALGGAHGVPTHFRSGEAIRGLLAGFDLLDPGVVPVHRWRPSDAIDRGLRDGQMLMAGGVALVR